MSDPKKETHLQRLVRVTRELDQFIQAHSSGGIQPIANFMYAPNGPDTVQIGEIMVWCSEESGGEELTRDACLQEYRDILLDFMTIFEDGDVPERPDPPAEPNAIEGDASKA